MKEEGGSQTKKWHWSCRRKPLKKYFGENFEDHIKGVFWISMCVISTTLMRILWGAWLGEQ